MQTPRSNEDRATSPADVALVTEILLGCVAGRAGALYKHRRL